MSGGTKQRLNLANAVLDGALVRAGLGVTPNSGAGAVVQHQALLRRKEVIVLTDFEVSIDSGDDYGGTKLCDLPNTNLIFRGVVVDLAVTVAGLTVNTAAALDVAVGTVVTASTDFSNSNEDNLVGKIDGVGAAATGTVDGESGSGILDVYIAAGGSNAVYLNASSAVASGTGTATFSGTVTLLYDDVGNA